jgi:amino acid transporter
MARDNMLPISHLCRKVSPKSKAPTYAVLGLRCHSTVLLLSALVNEKAFNYIIGIASLLFFFVYILQTVGLLVGYRKGTIPESEPGTFDLGRWRLPLYVTALVAFLGVAVALLFLPQFTNNKWVFLGIVVIAVIWWATGVKSRLRSGDAGADYAKTHNI